MELDLTYQNTLEAAESLDQLDPLAGFREHFHIPEKNGKPVIYLCGNSLGLQPKNAEAAVQQELHRWKTLAVEGHFKGELPWLPYHKALAGTAAEIVGALPSEVTIMNTLTVNLHLMMVSFYRPTSKRNKILIEANAFPSDRYALASQIKWHGHDPGSCLIEPPLHHGKAYHRTEDILATIDTHKDELALVMMGGINYYSGQFFDLPSITRAAHEAGAVAGFDLAHTAGNIPLKLHDWDVDFAVWCNYKYLNSGPGALSGAYVHERFGKDWERPRFAGWWGYPEKERFKMLPDFIPEVGAEGWQLSNAPILSMAPIKASFALFHEAGMDRLREKSYKLTGYLEFLIKELNQSLGREAVRIITPENPKDRGCQLSLVMEKDGKSVYDRLEAAGVVLDWREPNVLRAAPVPMYNSFKDVFHFVAILKNAL